MLLMMVVFLLAMAARLVWKIIKFKPEPKPLSLTVISQCKSCGKKHMSKFKVGDHLLKPCGKCECGGTFRMIKIYNDEETKEERKWKAYEKRFEV